MYSVGVRPGAYQGRGGEGRRLAAAGLLADREEIVLVNTPGVTTSDLSFFTYQHRRHPLYPFELDTKYP